MYTFLITTLILFVALFCIYKKSNSQANTRLLIGVIFVIVSIITTSLVNIYRIRNLKTEIVIGKLIKLYPTVIKTDTTWILKDCILNDSNQNKKYSIQEFNVKPDSLKKSKFEHKIINCYGYVTFNKSDSAIYVSYMDGLELKPTSIDTDILIVPSDENMLIKMAEQYIPDNWTTSLALPTKRTWWELHIKSSTLDSLICNNKIIETKWKIKK